MNSRSFTNVSFRLVILLSIIPGLSGKEAAASLIGWLAELSHSHSQSYIQARAYDHLLCLDRAMVSSESVITRRFLIILPCPQ